MNNNRALQHQLQTPTTTHQQPDSASILSQSAIRPTQTTGQIVTTTVTAASPTSGADRTVDLQYADNKVIGNGSFGTFLTFILKILILIYLGVVYLAKLVQTNEQVAIKKVLQDKRFKVLVF